MANYSTVSRKKIMEYLVNNSDKAVNVQDINVNLIEQGCGVNITTIYRYLDKLTKDGSVMKYTSEDGNQAVYQYVSPTNNCEAHLHMKCTKCGLICHLDMPIMSSFSKQVKDSHGFDIQCRNSIIYGVCRNCE